MLDGYTISAMPSLEGNMGNVAKMERISDNGQSIIFRLHRLWKEMSRVCHSSLGSPLTKGIQRAALLDNHALLSVDGTQ